MRGEDYKDALNELTLSESFCKKMERKLLDAEFTEDEYFDEVVHVDVVRKRSRKSFAAAAALILALGAGGVGTASLFRDRFKNELSAEEDVDTDDEEIGMKDNDEEIYQYAFPFGSVDFRDVAFSFSYNTDHSSFPTTIPVSAKQAEMIKELFSDVEWELYEPKENIYDLECCKESIGFSTVNRKFNITFWADGNVETIVNGYENGSMNCSIYYYMISPEKYKVLKDMIFGDLKLGHLESFGIDENLEGARYSIYDKSGTLSSEQAYDISRVINTETEWTLLGENAAVPEEDPDMSIEFRSQGNRIELDIYGSQKLLVVSKISDRGLLLKREIYEGDKDFRSPIEKVLCGSVACECPLDYEDADHALVEYYNGEKWIGYNIDREQLDGLLNDMRGMNWKELYNVRWQLKNYKPDMEKAIIIRAGDICTVMYSNGELSYRKGVEYDIYSFDGYDYIEEQIKSLPDAAVSDSDFVDLLIDNIFEGSDITLASEERGFDKSRSVFTDEEIERFKEDMRSLEWESYNVGNYGLGSSSALLSDSLADLFSYNGNPLKYILYSDNNIFDFYSDGAILSALPKWGVKCKEPDKLFELLDDLLEKK